MIAVNSITNRLYTLFALDPVLTGSGFRIENGAPLNGDPDYAPWIGILRGRVSLQPYIVGGVHPWRGSLDIHVYHQEYSLQGSADVLRRLDMSADYLTTLIGSNTQLDGLVGKLEGIDAELFAFNEAKGKGEYFATHLITLRYQVTG